MPSANPASAASSSLHKRGCAASVATSASSVVTDDTATAGSIAAISRRSSDARAAGSPAVRATTNSKGHACCRRGRYTASSGAAWSPEYLTLEMTPTSETSSLPGAPLRSTGRVIVRPIGSPAPKNRRAVSTVMIITGGSVSASASEKKRPLINCTPRAEKYPGVAGTPVAS